MIIIKSRDEIEKMRRAGEIVAETHRRLREWIVPGVTTLELDRLVEEFQRSQGAIPAQKGYQGFPYTICASVDDEICHGFPSDKPLEEGQLITIDMVVEFDGYMADSAWSYGVGQVSEEVEKLMKVTKECLYLGIEQAQVDKRLGDVGHAIQTHAENHGYQVVRDFVGHGIGKEMHEEPKVLHYGSPNRGARLQNGMVLTIEPMINTGRWNSRLDSNGWTARTVDGSLSCQYEHTIAITKNGPLILTEQD